MSFQLTLNETEPKKVEYVANTTIPELECCAMSGSVREMIAALAKYERNYPSFFMDYSNEKGRTLLMVASKLGHFGLIKYLIDRYMKYKNAIFDKVLYIFTHHYMSFKVYKNRLSHPMEEMLRCCCCSIWAITLITSLNLGDRRSFMVYHADTCAG